MNMPMDLVMMRHGQSEANVVQGLEKSDVPHPQTNAIYARHDYEQRLARDGLTQPLLARDWLLAQGIAPEQFDEAYVSPLYRTLETAAILGGQACLWLPETKIIERDWGIFGATPLNERRVRFADTERMKQLSSFFTRFDGGESMYDVTMRFRMFLDTLSREKSDQRILAVTHGELMWAARFVIERLMPHEWQAMDGDKTLRIGNCCLLWYSRQNPEDADDVRLSLSDGWRLMYNPVEPQTSPYGGEWQKLSGKRRFNAQQINELLRATAPLLNREVQTTPVTS